MSLLEGLLAAGVAPTHSNSVRQSCFPVAVASHLLQRPLSIFCHAWLLSPYYNLCAQPTASCQISVVITHLCLVWIATVYDLCCINKPCRVSAINKCLHWLFSQALAQNSELRERLSKIHVESHIVEPTLINLTAPVQVGAGMQWLHSLSPTTTTTIMMIILISIFLFFHPTLSRVFATEWMSCPFPLFEIHPLTRLTLSRDDNDCKKLAKFSLLHTTPWNKLYFNYLQ